MPPQQQPGSAGGGQNSPQSQQNLNQIVLEYLSKKGYYRTESSLRREIGNLDSQGHVKRDYAEDHGGKKPYEIGIDLLNQWIEGNPDVYKAELKRLRWPIFVYSYLNIVLEGTHQLAEAFFRDLSEPFENEHKEDLQSLKTVTLPEHVELNEVAKAFRNNEYRLTLTKTVYYLLIQFLENKAKEGGTVILNILNNSMNIVTIDRAQAGHDRAFNTLVAKLHGEDEVKDEDEGIPGHQPGSANTDKDAPKALPRLFLGPKPKDPELNEDVQGELEDEDERNPPEAGQTSLVEEYTKQIKREQSEDEVPWGIRTPLPKALARDVMMEVQRIKDHRDRFQVDPKIGGFGAGLSVCMFTFHNTHDSIISIDFSADNLMIAAGTSDSYIRVWSLEGKALPSMVPDPPGTADTTSRKLYGHSGPVYQVSFSSSSTNPSSDSNSPSTTPRYLLSCSADKTIRLWSVDMWTCLVIYRGHLQPVWDIKWGPYGHYFLSGSNDKTARLWTTDHPSPHRYFVGHDQDVDCVDFHPNNAYVFTGSSDKTVRMWEISRGTAVRMFTGHVGNVTCVSCAPTGRTLASADDAGHIILWDLARGTMIKRMRGHSRGGIWSLSWSLESNVLISGGADNTVRVWDIVPQTENAAAANKAAGDAGAAGKIDGAGSSGISGPGGAKNKKGKEVTVTPDQLGSFLTKKTPVQKVKFTTMNLVIASGPYCP